MPCTGPPVLRVPMPRTGPPVLRTPMPRTGPPVLKTPMPCTGLAVLTAPARFTSNLFCESIFGFRSRRLGMALRSGNRAEPEVEGVTGRLHVTIVIWRK